MSKKKSSWGQQEYVPAGNGDASGEYADESGSNKHFEVFKKPTLEIKSSIDETKKEETPKQTKFGKFKKENKEEIVLEEKEQTADLKTTLKETKKYVKSLSVEETKEILTGVYENLIDKNKIENLDEKKLKELLIAAAIVDNEQSFNNSSMEEKYKADFFNDIKEKKLENVWFNLPKTAADFEISVEKKIEWYKNQGNDAIVNALETTKNSELFKKWKESTNKTDLSKYKKLVDKYYNENDLYSQKAKDKAKWLKSIEQSKKVFSPYANKVISEWQQKEPHAISMIKDYTGSFSSINSPLREMDYPHKNSYSEQSKEKQKTFIEHVEGMTKVIDSSTYDFNCWVQRGISQLKIGDDMLDYNGNIDLKSLEGKFFQDQGFLSCGSSKGAGFANNNIIMNIYCPKGTKMLYVPSISYYPKEDETIIQRGYTYKITKVEKSKGQIFLDCEVILGSDSKKHDLNKLKELQKKHF